MTKKMISDIKDSLRENTRSKQQRETERKINRASGTCGIIAKHYVTIVPERQEKESRAEKYLKKCLKTCQFSQRHKPTHSRTPKQDESQTELKNSCRGTS